MVKEPRPGRVKTRLARDIGATTAAWWYRHQTRSLIRRLHDPRWDIVLSTAPDTAILSRVWPRHVRRLPQGGGDLGQRMARALAHTPGPTLLIGSDIPGIQPTHIAEAFQLLGTHRSVIGPSEDGGYWLVGLHMPRRQDKSLFKNVRWSHPETMADTLPTLPGPTGIAARLKDVDTVQDL